MEKHLTLFLILSLSSCNGDLGRLSGLLIGAHQQIHNKVHDVADAVLGGLNLNVHGHVGHHHHRPAQPSQPETIVVIVEETNQGDQPQGPYGPPHQGQYQPNGQRPPNGYNQGYNQNSGYNPNHQFNNPRPNPPVNNGQGPYQTGPNNNNYANGNSVQPQNFPDQNGQNYNQNGQTNNNIHNNNVNPNNDGDGNPNVNNNPNQNGNVVNHPEQNKPNLNDNYKPTETYNGQQQSDGHHAENTHKETNDKTTKKPEDDGPLFVPLNDYTYGGDKIVINPPKRDTENKKEDSEEDFPIDIRFKDE